MTARIPCLLAVALLAQCAAAAGAAEGFERAIPAERFASGPVLAGDAVLHAERRPDDGSRIVRTPLDGGPPGALADLTATPGSRPLLVDYGGSADGFAFAVAERGEASSSYGVTGARYGEAEQGLGSCSLGTGVAVSGSTVVYDSCGLRAARLGEGGPGRLLTSEPGRVPQAAEPFAAYLNGTAAGPDVVVLDLSTGREVYRMPASELPGTFRGYTLSPDGTVAVLYSVRRRAGGRTRTVRRVAWASPAERRYRRVPLPDARRLTAKVVGERVAFAISPLRARREWLGVTGLRSGRRIVARGDFGATIDFDGRRLAHTVERGRRTLLRVVGVR